MGDLLIRDLAPDTHEELKRRANAVGKSLQAYVRQILERSVATSTSPGLATWLEQLDELPRHRGIAGAATVRALRTALP